MATFRATRGSEEGFNAFDRWSHKHPSYNADDTRQRWEAIRHSPPDRIGAGTLFFLADRAAPGWRDNAANRPGGRRAGQANFLLELASEADLSAAMTVLDTPTSMLARVERLGQFNQRDLSHGSNFAISAKLRVLPRRKRFVRRSVLTRARSTMRRRSMYTSASLHTRGRSTSILGMRHGVWLRSGSMVAHNRKITGTVPSREGNAAAARANCGWRHRRFARAG